MTNDLLTDQHGEQPVVDPGETVLVTDLLAQQVSDVERIHGKDPFRHDLGRRNVQIHIIEFTCDPVQEPQAVPGGHINDRELVGTGVVKIN